MDTTGSNGGANANGSSSSSNAITGKAGASKQHGNSARHLQSVIGKQSSSVRKMSTMPEEEDGSDDMDRVDEARLRRYHRQNHHQQQQDADSDTPSEERGRLLNSAGGTRKIAISPAGAGNVHCNGVRRAVSRDGSIESVQERPYTRSQQYRPVDQAGQLEPRLSREAAVQALSRISRTGDPHAVRYSRCSSVRSVKSNPTMDERQSQNYYQYHPSTASWASIVFADGSGQTQTRPFPDSVSIRSLASIGLGSSDGRKLTIRRIPTSPSELLNMVHPPP